MKRIFLLNLNVQATINPCSEGGSQGCWFCSWSCPIRLKDAHCPCRRLPFGCSISWPWPAASPLRVCVGAPLLAGPPNLWLWWTRPCLWATKWPSGGSCYELCLARWKDSEAQFSPRHFTQHSGEGGAWPDQGRSISPPRRRGQACRCVYPHDSLALVLASYTPLFSKPGLAQ